MRSDFEINENIEKYLNGELDGQELIQFEEKLNTDAEFLQRVLSFQSLTESISFYGKRKSLKMKLNQFHEGLPSHSDDTSKVISIWRKNRKTILVAASVAAVSVISTLLVINPWYIGNHQNVKFTELRREIDKLKRNQNAIINDISKSDVEVQAVKPVKYSGTGFAITLDGYIVTSYHVIKDAGSFIVENSKNSYKAVVVFKDQAHDLAILKIEDDAFKTFQNLPYTLKSKDALLGENVYTLGYPREDIVYGEGSVSSNTGYEGDTASYQVSIPVNPGNSGGPLFDSKGNVIGLISGKQAELDAAAFAVRSGYILGIVDSLTKKDEYRNILVPKINQLSGLARPQQISKVEDFVFNVKVFN